MTARHPILGALLALGTAVFLVAASTSFATAAPSHDAIEGSGSSWSQKAVDQWIADVKQSGLRLVYNYPGSAQGRKDFASSNTDFGVSDIGYQGTDPKTGAQDKSDRHYAYLPIVAGGTSFPYQIMVAGKAITDLRLSGLTLAKIFTGGITNWNDAAITADNNGRVLPSKQIIPVVHSEGAGSTAQFTAYLASMYPAQWSPYNGSPSQTEYYPAKGNIIAQNGSDGVMSYIKSKAGDGTIGFAEYAYPLLAHIPVAKIQNPAGYYTLPTDKNDAVALTQAQIDMNPASPNYLLQNLANVYRYTDPRSYPLSSYSYAIIPTAADDGRMTTPKRQTLADYLFYAICGGQAEMGPIGYSPLPLNLVKASFAQVAKLKVADPKVDITAQDPANCDNPTFDKTNPDRNLLAEIAPQPLACDKAGAGPCDAKGTVNPAGAGAGGAPGAGAGGAGAGAGGAGAGNTQASTGATTPTDSGAAASASIDPETGQVISGGGNQGGSGGAATALDLAAYARPGNNLPFAILAAALFGVAVIVPPLMIRRLRQNRDQRP
jgi:phosphate transport system substrate-binding protein